MRIAGTNRFYPIPTNETEALTRGPIPMPRVGVTGGRHDDSDGDSSASLEEISAEDFKQDNGRSASRSRVWMGDLMRYPMSRNFAPDLYSFAWAQAVQNKPLGFDLAEKKEEDELDCDNVVIEDSDEEKEEGEIEEGEIDLGSEVVGKTEVPESENDLEMNKESEEGISAEKEEEKEEIGDFDRRVGTILEELDAITEEETETSFESVCSRLLKCFASLKEMFAEDRVPVLDALVQQSFMGIQTVCSVFSSGKLKNKEQNKDLLLRLLVHIKNQYSLFLKPEQVKEIDSRLQSLVTETASIENNKHARSAGNVSSYSGLVSSETPNSLSRAVNAFGSSYRGKAGLPGLELPSTLRSRVDFSPLLDLHADYDEGSLPSPTRDNAPPLPALKPIGFGMPAVRPTRQITPKVVQAENGTLHPYYVTDAFKAVSSYQQKYGRTSFDATNRLPSPTPSEDGNDDDDAGSEVSSYSAASNNRNLNKLNVVSPVASSSSAASIYSSSGPQLAPVRPAVQLSTGTNSVTKAPAKSRDPRLRFMNSEVGVPPRNENLGGSVNSRKQKAADESVLDENSMKRQKNGSLSYRDARVASGSGGWIEDNGVAASQTSDRIQMVDSVRVDTGKTRDGEVVFDRRLDTNTKPSVSSGESISNTAVSLPSLLKDFAVNPTMLMELLKMEQQRQAAEVQNKTTEPTSNITHGPGINTLSTAAKSAEVAHNLIGKPQMPAQTAPMQSSQNDVGRIRMKPRDPRRILHNNITQKSENSGADQMKSGGTVSLDAQITKDRSTVREQGEQAQTPSLPVQPNTLPDISRLFTKNLMNVADIVSSSQLSTSQIPPGSQVIAQPVPSVKNKELGDTKTVAGTVPGLPLQGGTTGASANPWGDEDLGHLLNGYDDEQKAAIQKERARRIAEQNKMFAAKKLCLVLDLDHTLLNSAKFVEVDPVHEEILRKKEEQDREKPQRHLYRFQHMGMWTKLRPGIWNFLEKASKLFELHLYTMGNKLYATEMAKVLDPTGALFAGRVISKGDDGDPFDGDERVPKTKDLDGVLGMESAVVIIDDSVRVWPHNKLNLIIVERYTYFPCSRRQFGLLGPSLLEIDHDERPEDGTLASSLAVIERIHQSFFSHHSLHEIDVRNILAAEQRKILSGCRIVFSRVFPVGEVKPHLHPLWQTAEQFGAVCTNQIDEQVTHVVANSLGTDKVNWALSTGRFVVHPGWVEASALLYRRVNELDFTVKQ